MLPLAKKKAFVVVDNFSSCAASQSEAMIENCC